MSRKFSTYLNNKRQYKNSPIHQFGGNDEEEPPRFPSDQYSRPNKKLGVVLSKAKRGTARKLLMNRFSYSGKFYLLGCGAIGKALLYLIIKLYKDIAKNIIIIERQDLRNEVRQFLAMGVHFIQQDITQKSYKQIFMDIKKDDIIIDCAYGMSTTDFLLLCQEKGCHYLSSAIDHWNYKDFEKPLDASLYNKYTKIEAVNKSIGEKKFNALVAMGANPGNVSIWTKFALDIINKKSSVKHEFKTYAELAKKLGVQVIHVSERDCQLNGAPKRINEYCNTWSTDGESYYEEALGFAEGSWGTHEKKLPDDIISTENNYFIVNRLSLHSYAQSYVPLYGAYVGNIIPHEETFTIGKHLTIYDKDKVVYKPSVYYVYHPCNDARMSVEELKEKDYEYQTYYRLLTKELISGRDELGLTFFLENGDVYWIGSLLDVDEAREVYNNEFNDNINATILQVVSGCLSGLLYLTKLNKKINKGKDTYKGLIHPDDLPHRQILKWSLPFLGSFVFEKVENFDLYKIDTKFTGKNIKTTEWQYQNFMVYK
jgi:homospermidine synthase